MAARLTAFVVAAIVAITFVAGLIVGAQREDESGPIDLIVYNGRIYVGDPAKGFAEAMAVRGNRIMRVGSNHDIRRFMRRATTLIDAKGGSVLPGFNDGALDLFAEGYELDAVRQTIASAHSVGLTSAHVVLRSADDLTLLEDLEKRGELTLRVSASLTATLPIDAAEVDRLEAIRRLHPGDALLKVASVRLVVPVGGIAPVAVKPPAVAAAAAAAAAATVATPAGHHARTKKAPTPVVVINADNLATAIAMLDQHNWQVIVAPADAAGVDMTLAAFTAALKTPRVENTPRRHRIELPSPLDATMSAQFDALGIIQSFQTAAAPAIEPAPEAAAPNAAATRAAAEPAPRAAADAGRATTVAATSAAEGGVPPSSAASDGATAGQAAKHAATGAQMAGRATTVAATSASEGGVPPSSAASDGATAAQAPTHAAISTRAIFRSDWPARPLDPRITLAAAVAAEPETTATERAAWLAGAIDAYTARAAYASFDETRKGTIAKDMLADFVIFTADLFAPKQDTPIADAAITATVVNGRIVFNATQTKPAPTLSTAP